MTTLSKDEYLKASRGLATGFGSTVDFADPQVGGTVQSTAGVGDTNDQLPGQVFSVDQLPDPAVAVAFGMPPVTIPEHLILDSAEDAENHIQGKDVLDIANGQLRRGLDDPILSYDNTVRSSKESLLSFSDRTGTNAGTLQGAVEAEEAKEQSQEVDDTGSGRPIDTEGVQQPDSGGTEAVPAANDKTEDSKASAKGGTQKSGAKQGS